MGEPGLFLNDRDSMRLTCEALAVRETSTMGPEKYKVLDPTKQVSFFTSFRSDRPGGLLYSALKKVYPSLIVGVAFRLTTAANHKLHTAAIRELLPHLPAARGGKLYLILSQTPATKIF